MRALAIVALVCGCTGSIGSSSSRGTRGLGVENGLSVGLSVTEEAPDASGNRVWRADVTVQCVVNAGSCTYARTDLRWAATGGGTPTLMPVSGRPSPSEPFVIPLSARDQEIVVALWNTTNELRVLRRNPDGSMTTVAQADLPNRIEALTTGDVDNDGLDEIVVGLDGTTAAHVRVFRYDHPTGGLIQEIVSGILPQHVEGIAVGDADNDGLNEIAVGLEYGANGVSRVRIYSKQTGTWVETLVSAASSLHVQDVKIDDVDDDGQNEICALQAIGGGVGPTQTTVYRKISGTWTAENAIYRTGVGAERLVVADADGDGDNEMLTGYWNGFGANNMLVTIDKVGGVWTESTIGTNFVVDGLAVGDFDGDARPDVLAGDWSSTGRTRRFEWNPSNASWEMTLMTEPIGQHWDVDLGDWDNDGSNEVILANNLALRGVDVEGTSTVLATFPVNVDSALVTDADHDEDGNPRVCNLMTGSCTETFRFISGAESPAGSWALTAHAADLAVSASGSSDAVTITTGTGLVDCNANTISDAEDIATLRSFDCNINGVPDECEGGTDYPEVPLNPNATVQILAREFTGGAIRMSLSINGGTFNPLFGGAAGIVGSTDTVAVASNDNLVFRAWSSVQTSETGSSVPGAWALADGSNINDIDIGLTPWNQQRELGCYVAPFVDPATGAVHLPNGAMLVLFEVGGGDPERPTQTAWDMQDLVALVTPPGGGGGGGEGGGAAATADAPDGTLSSTASPALTCRFVVSPAQAITYECPVPICIPWCEPGMCGSDGCGGTCACPEGSICSLRGFCKAPFPKFERYAAY